MLIASVPDIRIFVLLLLIILHQLTKFEALSFNTFGDTLLTKLHSDPFKGTSPLIRETKNGSAFSMRNAYMDFKTLAIKKT